MVVFLLPERDGVINREAIGAVYGTVEKPVNQRLLEVTGRFPYRGRMIRTVHGFKPTVPTSCFIDESGIAIGNVMLDEPCSVSFHPSFAGTSEYSRLHYPIWRVRKFAP